MILLVGASQNKKHLFDISWDVKVAINFTSVSQNYNVIV